MAMMFLVVFTLDGPLFMVHALRGSVTQKMRGNPDNFTFKDLCLLMGSRVVAAALDMMPIICWRLGKICVFAIGPGSFYKGDTVRERETR